MMQGGDGGGKPMGEGGGKVEHYLHHLLKHQKEIGLNADQVTKLKGVQLEFTKTAAHSKAESQVRELELASLVDDPGADAAAIEAKVRESENNRTTLRLATIKAEREAKAMLTPEQRDKEQAIHGEMMRKMRGEQGGKQEGGGGAQAHQH
jgi:Spy/CpxP family protein refolding chaperone